MNAQRVLLVCACVMLAAQAQVQGIDFGKNRYRFFQGFGIIAKRSEVFMRNHGMAAGLHVTTGLRGALFRVGVYGPKTNKSFGIHGEIRHYCLGPGSRDGA